MLEDIMEIIEINIRAILKHLHIPSFVKQLHNFIEVSKSYNYIDKM